MTRMNEANKVFEAFKPESNRICPSFSWQRYEPLPAIHHLSHYSRKRPGSGNSSAECAEMCRESKSRKGIWKGLELSSRPQSSAHSLLYSRRAGGTSSLAFGASVTVQTLMSKPLFFFSTTFLDGVVAFSLGLIGFFPSTRSTDLIWTTKSSLLGGVGGGGMTLAPLAFEAATASGVTSCDSISTVTLPPEPGAFASMERYTTFFADPLSTERICVLTGNSRNFRNVHFLGVLEPALTNLCCARALFLSNCKTNRFLSISVHFCPHSCHCVIYGVLSTIEETWNWCFQAGPGTLKSLPLAWHLCNTDVEWEWTACKDVKNTQLCHLFIQPWAWTRISQASP